MAKSKERHPNKELDATRAARELLVAAARKWKTDEVRFASYEPARIVEQDLEIALTQRTNTPTSRVASTATISR